MPLPRLVPRRAKPGLPLACAVLLAASCHPYGDSFQGQFNAGAADPFNFPPPYRGSGSFTREKAGSGSFTERKATAHGAPANYFFFPFSPTQISTTGYAAVDPAKVNPLRIVGPGAIPAPPAFQFDPGPPGTPEQDTSQCTPPQGYAYDAFRDDVNYANQGNVVSALPVATYGVGSLPTWSYTPVVQRVTVTSKGEACQSVKSDLDLVTRSDLTVALDPTPNADGTPHVLPDPVYLAWPVIDPGAAVYRVGQSAANSAGLDVQHFGWYRQFLIAYLDGGQIPTRAGAVPGSQDMVTQRLFFPRAGYAKGNSLGGGNDLLEYTRDDAGYSPVCAVYSFTVPAGTPPPASVAAIDANAAYAPQAGGTIDPKTGAVIPAYVFCLQAR